MPYQILQDTSCDGWTNFWYVENSDGTSQPMIYNTLDAAEAELDQFFGDIEREIADGTLAPDEGYSREEFTIVKVSA